MDNLVFNIMFCGIFFLVLTVFQYNVSKFSSNSSAKSIFILLLIIRIFIYFYLITNDSFLGAAIFIDFISTFVYSFLSGVVRTSTSGNTTITSSTTVVPSTIDTASISVTPSTMKCPKCNALINAGDKFCGECGNNLTQVESPATIEPIYLNSEQEILEELIKEITNKNNYNINATLPEMKKRKIIITAIFGIISLILTSLIFFHISFLILPLEIINIIVYLVVMRKFNTIKYLIKEIKSRPDEDLEYVVSNVLSNVSTFKYSGLIYASVMIVSIVVPLIVFSKPHYFYEYTKDGYYIRFYTTSYEPEEHIRIPETYKGKKVIGIRGNVFMNLKNLKSVTLPDTMEVIRGNAFRGDSSLESINLPSKLTYLGGGAFMYCSKLKDITIPEGITEIHGNTFAYTAIESIEIPDTVLNIGGSAFMNCEKLKTVKLPKNITEIHGNTFENCASLESIDIPDGVTRIGGHAFYNNMNLTSVNFTENSRLQEIGSSAFRLCTRLSAIKLPASATNINERAFKDSPTTVYYYGDVMYGIIVDESKYEHKSFAYLKVGEELMIGKYYEDAICHNDKLILTNIIVNQDKVVYSLEYIGKYDSKTFTIDSNVPYSYVNDNLAVEIDSKYAATNPNSLSFNVYYN